MHTCVGVFPSSPQTLPCRDCRWSPSSLSLTLSFLDEQADTSERGLCLARALPFLSLPCYCGHCRESQAAGTQSLVMFVCFMCQCMFFHGGFCCLSRGCSSHCPVVTCFLSRGTTSLSGLPPSLHCSRAHSTPAVSLPHPYPVFSHVDAALPLAHTQRSQDKVGWWEDICGHGSCLCSKFSLAFSCFFRKRTHSPSSKDEQSIGLKDSLLAHSSDPVEMRRLNYQTPGRADPSASWPPA